MPMRGFEWLRMTRESSMSAVANPAREFFYTLLCTNGSAFNSNLSVHARGA